MATGLPEPTRQQLIADRRDRHLTIDQLCEKYRIGDTSVRAILKKAGVKIGRQPRGKAVHQ
jgi:hypothetical protein